ncbi:MAG: ABC transporter substrate-binding protein [Aquisalinus sp.]|nr:ABC transporter substrate-binding protein [Aquisalinus sp.]
MRSTLLSLYLLLCVGCAQESFEAATQERPDQRIISLDYCADQYVLALIPRDQIIGLSPDAEESFSYLRTQAAGIPKVRPRAEDILLRQPDIVVRSYGGGANITPLLERSGIKVVQIGYASDLAGIEAVITATAAALDNQAGGDAFVAQLSASRTPQTSTTPTASVLYLTSKGAVAGKETLIDDIITSAGLENFRTENSWTGSIPLESLVYAKPDIIAAGFFETSDLVSDIWTPTRHPVAQRLLKKASVVDIPGSWTSCSAWPVANAVEALTIAATNHQEASHD